MLEQELACMLSRLVMSNSRVLECVAIASSRGSSRPRDRIRISCIGRWILYHLATWRLAWCDNKSKERHRMLVGGSLSLGPSFLSNTISWGSKPHVSASSLLLPPQPDQYLEDALKESSISLLYILIELLYSNKFQTKSILKIFFECLLWLELHVVRVGVRWGGDQVYVGEDTTFWCFVLVFRSSWVSWTMKRKCLLSKKKNKKTPPFIWSHQWLVNLNSVCKLLRAG